MTSKLSDKKQSVEVILSILNTIQNDDDHSQRNLASQAGVALGLVNALIRRCVKKGLLKIHDAPARRYAYYITPKGFREKSRLTAEYISSSLGFFRQSREQYIGILDLCLAQGWRNIAFYGVSELSEIAFLAAQDTGVESVVMIDPGQQGQVHCGLNVCGDLGEVLNKQSIDAFVVTETSNPQEVYDMLVGRVDGDRVFAPAVLNVVYANDDGVEP